MENKNKSEKQAMNRPKLQLPILKGAAKHMFLIIQDSQE